MLTEKLNNIKTKNVPNSKLLDKDYPDFHVDGIDSDTIIELQNGGLDDIEEFNCSMYNYGDMDDLPNSDRDMIPNNQTCREYRR